MFRFYNANPKGRRVNDCTVRAISLATDRSWDSTFLQLSDFARAQGIMPDEVEYIDEYLDRHFSNVYSCDGLNKITVGEFVQNHPRGVYLITMSGHITCCVDGVIYDTFDPSMSFVWEAFYVR